MHSELQLPSRLLCSVSVLNSWRFLRAGVQGFHFTSIENNILASAVIGN